MVTRYLQSLHWCMGLMTGMADGSLPLTTPQFYFTIFIMTAGVFLFAYTVGAIGSLDDNRMNRATVLQTQVKRTMRTQTIASPMSRAHRPFPASLTVRIDTAPCVGECDAALLGPLSNLSCTNFVGHKLLQLQFEAGDNRAVHEFGSSASRPSSCPAMRGCRVPDARRPLQGSPIRFGGRGLSDSPHPIDASSNCVPRRGAYEAGRTD